MPENSRFIFRISCIELLSALVVLAVNLYSPMPELWMGFTPSRLVLLGGIALFVLLLAVPAFAITPKKFQSFDGFVRDELLKTGLRTRLMFFSLLLAAVLWLFLIFLPYAGVNGLSSRFSFLWLCLELITLQNMLILGLWLEHPAARRIYKLVLKIIRYIKIINQYALTEVHEQTSSRIPVFRVWSGAIIQLLLLFIASLIYLQIFKHPSDISIKFRYGFTTAMLTGFTALLITHSLKGWTGFFASLTVTLLLFGLPLAGLWSGAYNESSVFRGLIPWSDANGYLMDANRLLDGGLFLDKSARRPLFTGLLSVLLSITHHNQQSALLILAALNAVCCFLAGRQVLQSHGRVASSLLVMILFTFYRRYAGTTLTENLGFAFGTLGFALLWRGAWKREQNITLAGIAVTTLALNARAGAYLVLPMLLLWAARTFRKQQTLSWRILFLGSGLALCCFALNMLLYRSVSVEQSSPEASFSNVLYGLTSGGEPWNQVYFDHPNIEPLSEPQHSQSIYRLARQNFTNEPTKTIQGMFKGWSYFFDFDKGMFNFIRSAFFDPNYLYVRWAIYLLSIMALIRAIRNRNEACTLMIIAALVGIILSVPFVPLWDAAYMRLYASTIPFLAALPVLGLSWVLQWGARQKAASSSTEIESGLMSASTLALSTALILTCIAGPLIIKATHPRPILETTTCSTGTQLKILRVSEGTYLNIIDDEQLEETRVPDIRHSNFIRGNNYDFPDSWMLDEIAELPAGLSLINSYDLLEGSEVLLLVDSKFLPGGDHIMAFCGEKGAGSPFFFAQSGHIVSE